MTAPAAARHYGHVAAPSNRSASPGLARSRTRRLAVPIALVTLGLAIAAGAAWLWWPRSITTSSGLSLGPLPRGAARDRLNVVVITLDTTRADRIGAYGARDVETPALDALARDGVVFEQAMATAPLTLPAHCSIFTGRFPPEHGVRDNGGFFLGPGQLTLAEMLKPHGFTSGAVVGAYVLDSKWGLDQGFDRYIDDFDLTTVKKMSLGSVQRPGNDVADKALAWLDQVKAERFFAWIHLYDPHTPYDPPEPYKSRYARHPYNGEIAFTDAQVGRITEFLRRNGLLDRTIVAVMGDHGESLGEHGEGTHGFFIYESATRVPFILRAPFDGPMRGRRVTDAVRAVDLVPTLLDLLGLPPSPQVSGASLVPVMTGSASTLDLEGYAEAMYPLHHFGWSDLKALRAGRFKLIDAPRPELYDLEADPGERTNVFAERRTLGDTMLARLRERSEGLETSAPPAEAVDVDPDARARLAALGYVGSFVATAATPRSGRADPKDKIELFNLMTTARDVSKDENTFTDVTTMLRQVVAADPQVIDAWFMLGNEHFKADRLDEAIGYFSRALELKPDYDLALINMANAYRRLGRDDAALAGYEHYLRVDPRNAYVWYQVGEIHLDRGDPARAEQHFRQALAIDDKVAPARNAMGALAFQRGDRAAAEAHVRAALAIKADVRLAHYNLAVFAEESGDMATAEAEYRQELALHATTYKAAFNLARLHARLGRTDEAIASYRQAIDINPRFAEGHFYLAKAYLDRGAPLDEALALARKGLTLSPSSTVAPLGHFVVAGVLMRQGRVQDAARALADGRALEARLASKGR